MSPECPEKNARGLTTVAVGGNQAAGQCRILDEKTKADLAGGKYHDQRRGSFGTSQAAVPAATPRAPAQPAARPQRPRQPEKRPAQRPAPREPWSVKQRRLALL